MTARAGTKNLKVPSLKTTEGFSMWKDELQLWDQVCGEASQSDKAAMVILNTELELVKRDLLKKKEEIETVQDVINAVEEILEKDPVCELFEKYRKFDQIERQDGESIAAFIKRFNNDYAELEKAYALKIPDPILCYKLIEGSGIDDSTKKIISTHCESLTLENVTKAFTKAYDFLASDNYSRRKIKTEVDSMLVSKHSKIPCYICGDTTHLQFECPHNDCSYKYSHKDKRWKREEQSDARAASQRHGFFYRKRFDQRGN